MSANGRLLATELKDVRRSTRMDFVMQLPVKAANSYLAFEAFAIARGKTPRPSDPGGMYRPISMQADMLVRPAWYGATPGKVASAGASVHGRPPGAVDIGNWDSFGVITIDATGKHSAVLDAWMGAFGWRRTIKSEPWHYEYNGVTYASGVEIASVRIRIEEESMKAVYVKGSDPELFAIINGAASRWIDVKQPNELAALQAVQNFAPTVELPAGNSSRTLIDGMIAEAKLGAAAGGSVVHIDEAAVAKEIVAALGADIVSDADLAALEQRVTAAIASVPGLVVKAEGAALSNG